MTGKPKVDEAALEAAQKQARKDMVDAAIRKGTGVDVSRPERIRECPTCDRTLPTLRKQRLVARRLREINEYLEAAIAEQRAGEPGYTESKSGIIVPTKLPK